MLWSVGSVRRLDSILSKTSAKRVFTSKFSDKEQAEENVFFRKEQGKMQVNSSSVIFQRNS